MNNNVAYSDIISELGFILQLASWLHVQFSTRKDMQETPKRLLRHAYAALESYKQVRNTTPARVATKLMLFAKMYISQAKGELSDEEMVAKTVSNITGGGETVAVTLAYPNVLIDHVLL